MLVLSLLGPIMYDNLTFSSSLLALQTAKSGSKVTLQVRSQGGYIEAAVELGKAMLRHDVTCHVAEAQSAALQLVLPACKRIVVQPNAVIGWHSATGCREAGYLDGKELVQWLRESVLTSAGMAAVMRKYLGPLKDDSCAQARDAMPEVAAGGCELSHMFAETVWTGAQFAESYRLAAPGRVRVAPVKVPSLTLPPPADKPKEGGSVCNN